MLQPTMPRAVLFDLDGTLVDSLRDLADAMNHVLEANGFRAHPVDDYRQHVGWGAIDLVRRALPEEARDDAPTYLEAFRDRYTAHLLDASAPYPGVREVLAELARREVPIAVLSNKPEESVAEVVQALLGEVPFQVVRGAREDVPHKPDPTAVLEVAQAMGLAPADCLYVGDTEIDIQTAKNAGMVAVGVSWGFRPERLEEADHVLREPADVLALALDRAR